MEGIKWFFRIIKENFKPFQTIFSWKHNSNSGVMTFNLRRDSHADGKNNWKHRRNSIMRMFNSTAPAIVGVQECMPHMWKFLKLNLKKRYAFNCSAEIVGARKLDKTFLFPSEGLGIFYDKKKYKRLDSGMFWLSDTPDRFSRTWGNDTPRICVWISLLENDTNKSILVLNTHLDHESGEARIKSSKLIHDFVVTKKFDEVYIMGDMNTSYNSSELKELNENYEVSGTFLTNGKGTFNNFKGQQSQQIDAIFWKNELKLADVQIITDGYGVDFLSDHYPLITRFEAWQ